MPRSDKAAKNPATGASSANPHCSACNPPLLFAAGTPVMGGLSGAPGRVTITPVYWSAPGYSFTSGYRSIVDGYLQNVAAASAQATNVFSLATEYYQQSSGSSPQHIQYAIAAGAEIDDSAAFPAQNNGPGCVADAGFSACVSDGDLQSELRSRVSALGLPIDDSHLYLVMFPSGVETCLGAGAASSTNECTTNSYCAYHSSSAGSPYLVYSNQPFPDLKHCTDPFNGAQAPNGDAEADSQISLVSHEANEAITDWAGAWSDSAGYEDGDECAYVYGAPLGSTAGSGTRYNQAIGSGRYYTQDEFSNAAYSAGSGDLTYASGSKVPGCFQRSPQPATPVVSAVAPASGSTGGGTSVTVTGTGLAGVTSVSFGGTPATGVTAVSDTQITAVSPSHSVGGADVTVTTGAGTSAVTGADKFTYVTPASQVACSTDQYVLTGSDGATWKQMDGTKLTLDFTASSNSLAILGGNADLWTAASGFNQDFGIELNGSLAGWKESGGAAGTYSPNAAYVQAAVPVTAGQTYTATLVWKASRPDPSTIAAGAGPIAGRYSTTCLDVRLAPTTDASKSSTTQHSLANSDGSTWQPLDAGLNTAVTPSASGEEVVAANADLWTANSGFNQDLGIFVSVNGGADQLVAWKESGGSAGTFSPNAAFVEAVWPVSSGSTYVFKLEWKTSQNAQGASIFAGAGPISGQYSPTRLTAYFEPAGSIQTTSILTQRRLTGSDGSTWQAIDASGLQTTFTASTSGTYAVSGNADLWTADAGFNQDVAIFISGGAYTTPTQVAWKESGGLAGTYSPNAAYVETALSLQASTTYTIWLSWKTNKAATGATIVAGAGPLSGGAYSPTRLVIAQL